MIPTMSLESNDDRLAAANGRESSELFAKMQTPDPEVQLLDQNILNLLQGYHHQLVELGASESPSAARSKTCFPWRVKTCSMR